MRAHEAERPGYSYAGQRDRLFTEDGQRSFLAIRDKVQDLLGKAGAFQSSHVMIGDSWLALAALDRMVELGELREVTDSASTWGQHRVFVRSRE
jgi:hypothetical protein